MQLFRSFLRYSDVIPLPIRGTIGGYKTIRISITMKKKSRIDTYATIYYVDLVVANSSTTLDELKKLYTYSDGQELDDFIMKNDCTTNTIIRKSDDKDCILVKYNHHTHIKGVNLKDDYINAIGHEAGHVVLEIYDHMHQNVCQCSQEPFCYLLGWVTECLNKTLQNEVK